MSTLAERLESARRTQFVGRSAERALFQSALTAPESPFFVLHIFGPGGVGKTTLLHEFARLAKEAGVPVIYLDGRNIDPAPDFFLLALQQALGAGPAVSPFAYLAEQDGRFVILIDTSETLTPLDGWLRDEFVPKLPQNTLIVFAGRNPPAIGWRADPGWQALARTLSLRNLDADESLAFLNKRQIPAERHRAVLNFTHGHPLALSLVADLFAHQPDFEFRPQEAPDVIRTLLEHLAQELPGPAHRAALEACALVRLTTEALLVAMLDTEDAHPLFQWLRQLSFIDSDQLGLFPHDLAREALVTDLRWRNREWYAELHRRARGYYLNQLEQSHSREQRRALFDYIFLHRDNPVVRPFFEWQESGTVFTDRMRAGDETAVLAMIAAHEGESSAQLAAHWLERQPQGASVFRDSSGKALGALIIVSLEETTEADRRRDPAIQAAWDHLQKTAPLRPGEHAAHFRHWLAHDTYQSVSPIQSRIFLNMVQHYLTAPGLAFTFLPCVAPDFWAGVFAYADLTLLPEAGFVVDGRSYAVYGHDWRVTPPMAWLGLMADREIEGQSLQSERPATLALVVLSESDFATAVRRALRDFSDPAALTGNPLIRSQLVARQVQANADEKTRAAALKELLRDTAVALQNTPRQAKFYRALHHTYIQPAPTQEKAAELLDLPFSTYRRHLRSGIQYVTERLWQLELSAAA